MHCFQPCSNAHLNQVDVRGAFDRLVSLGYGSAHLLQVSRKVKYYGVVTHLVFHIRGSQPVGCVVARPPAALLAARAGTAGNAMDTTEDPVREASELNGSGSGSGPGGGNGEHRNGCNTCGSDGGGLRSRLGGLGGSDGSPPPNGGDGAGGSSAGGQRDGGGPSQGAAVGTRQTVLLLRALPGTGAEAVACTICAAVAPYRVAVVSAFAQAADAALAEAVQALQQGAAGVVFCSATARPDTMAGALRHALGRHVGVLLRSLALPALQQPLLRAIVHAAAPAMTVHEAEAAEAEMQAGWSVGAADSPLESLLHAACLHERHRFMAGATCTLQLLTAAGRVCLRLTQFGCPWRVAGVAMSPAGTGAGLVAAAVTPPRLVRPLDLSTGAAGAGACNTVAALHARTVGRVGTGR